MKINVAFTTFVIHYVFNKLMDIGVENFIYKKELRYNIFHSEGNFINIILY